MFKILATVALLMISGCDTKTQKEDSNLSTTTQKSSSVEAPLVDTLDKNSSNSVEMDNTPLFTLNTIDGKKLNISEIENGLKFEELKEKAIFLIFFGYRCPPCIREVPILIELAKEHKDLAIVAVEVQGYDNKKLKAYGEREGINYNLISSDGHMDFIRYIQTKANWHGSIPFFLGLNSKGEVSIVHTGGIGKSALESAYKELIHIK